MTHKTKAAIEEHALYYALDTHEDGRKGNKHAYIHAANEIISHPHRYDLTARKPIGIQESRELVNQMLAEEISFGRFVELINEGGTK